MGIERKAGLRTTLALMAVLSAGACKDQPPEGEITFGNYTPASEENLKNKPVPITVRTDRERVSNEEIKILQELGKSYEQYNTEREKLINELVKKYGPVHIVLPGEKDPIAKELEEMFDDIDPVEVFSNSLPPLEVEEITDKFAWPTSGPIYGFFGGGHTGLDVSPRRWTPVVAANGGILVGKFDSNYGYGKHILVYHSQGFLTLYAHLEEYNAQLGDRVQRGEMIGWVGSTGSTTGPHLHFEVRHFGKAFNPLDYFQRAESSKGISPALPDNPKATSTPEPKVAPTPPSYKPLPK